MIDDSEIKKIAKLSYLAVEDKELERLRQEIGSILEYVNKLENVDVSKVSPMSHVHASSNVFREDIALKSLSNKEALQNAPDTSGRFIRVPIIIDQSSEIDG